MVNLSLNIVLLSFDVMNNIICGIVDNCFVDLFLIFLVFLICLYFVLSIICLLGNGIVLLVIY